jgi:hypothetical protein
MITRGEDLRSGARSALSLEGDRAQLAAMPNEARSRDEFVGLGPENEGELERTSGNTNEAEREGAAVPERR